MSLSESFAIPDVSGSDNDDIDSLPSTSTESFDSDEDYDDAQREWEASIQQLELLLTMIIIPFAGKYFGRKFSYWSRTFPAPMGIPESNVRRRLGKIHGMATRRRDNMDEQEVVQSCRGGRSGSNIMMYSHCIRNRIIAAYIETGATAYSMYIQKAFSYGHICTWKLHVGILGEIISIKIEYRYREFRDSNPLFAASGIPYT